MCALRYCARQKIQLPMSGKGKASTKNGAGGEKRKKRRSHSEKTVVKGEKIKKNKPVSERWRLEDGNGKMRRVRSGGGQNRHQQ